LFIRPPKVGKTKKQAAITLPVFSYVIEQAPYSTPVIITLLQALDITKKVIDQGAGTTTWLT